MEPIDGRARAAACAVLRFGSTAAARAAPCPAPGLAADESPLSSNLLCGVFSTTFATCTCTKLSGTSAPGTGRSAELPHFAKPASTLPDCQCTFQSKLLTLGKLFTETRQPQARA